MEGEQPPGTLARAGAVVHLPYPLWVEAVVVVAPQKMVGEVAVGPQIGEEIGDKEEAEEEEEEVIHILSPSLVEVVVVTPQMMIGEVVVESPNGEELEVVEVVVEGVVQNQQFVVRL